MFFYYGAGAGDPRGIMLDHTRSIVGTYSMKLDTQTQDDNPLERLYGRVKTAKNSL